LKILLFLKVFFDSEPFNKQTSLQPKGKPFNAALCNLLKISLESLRFFQEFS